MSNSFASMIKIMPLLLLILISSYGLADELELVLQSGHNGAVTDTVWLNDDYLVSGSADGSVKLWHIPSQRVRRTMWPPVEESKADSQGHSVRDLVLTEDGVWASHANGVLRLWDLTSGSIENRVELPEGVAGYYSKMVGDKQGKLYIFGQKTGFVTLDKSGKQRVNETERTVKVLTVTEDGNSIAFHDGKNTHFGNLESQETLPSTTTAKWGVDSLLFSPSGDTLYVGTRTNWIEAWDLKEKKMLYRVPVNDNAPDEKILSGPGFSAENLGISLAEFDEESLLALTIDGEVLKINKATGEVKPHCNFETYSLDKLAVSPNRQYLAGGSAYAGRSAVAVAHEANGKWDIQFLGGRTLNFTQLKESGKNLYLASAAEKVLSYDLSTGQPSRTYQTGYFPVMAVTSNRLFCGGNDGLLHAYDTENGKLLWEKSLSYMGARYGYGIKDVCLSPDGRDLVVSLAKNPNSIVFLDPDNGDIKKEIATPKLVRSLAFSRDGKQLFLAAGESVELYDMNYHKILHKWSATQFRNSSVVGLVNHPTEEALLALLHNGVLVKMDRHRLDLEPEFFTIHDIREARSMNLAGSNLLIAADHGASLVDTKGKVIKHYGDHLASVADAVQLGNHILTSGWDSRIEIWDKAGAENEATLLSLDEGSEWLVLTPDYHFDGSEKAQQLIEWRWKGELYELSRFFERFYQPGLLAQKLSGQEGNAAPASARGLGTQPPIVTIETPKSLENRFYEVTVKVEGEHSGWEDVRLYHNGHRVAGKSPFKFKAVEGENRLRASAFNKEKTVESEPHQIVFESKTPQPKSTLHVFAVGINDYPNALNYAVQDAKSFVEAFEPGLFGKVNKVTMYDSAASKEGIIMALSALECEPQDTLLVFLAGHGTILNERFHFLPHGSEGNDPEKALSSRELGQILASLPATRQVLFLDTCHAGASAKDMAELLVVKTPSLLSSNQGSQLIKDQKILARQAGTFLVAGSTPSATAAEIPELGHGLFTYAVLNGLKGEVGVQDVTINELLVYLSEKVPELSQKFRGSPHGIWQFSAGQDFPIVRR